jgi:ribose/xylose/arabinose/galactoside ABC-type transport system permease subunit
MRRHDLDPVSLVAGVVLAAIGVGFLTNSLQLTRLDGEWVWPVAAVAIGIAILLSSLRSGESDDERGETPAERETARLDMEPSP